MFSSCFMLFPKFLENKIPGGSKKKWGGGVNFFFRKTIFSHFMFSSRFMLAGDLGATELPCFVQYRRYYVQERKLPKYDKHERKHQPVVKYS